jgi:hypothetical protein
MGFCGVANDQYTNPQCGAPVNSRPSVPYDTSRIGFQGEFGGIGHNISIEQYVFKQFTLPMLTSSLWNKKRAIDAIDETYELDKTLDVWNDRAVCPLYPSYAKLTSQHLILAELLHQTHLYACSGGVWTETSDVEGEVNGLVT